MTYQDDDVHALLSRLKRLETWALNHGFTEDDESTLLQGPVVNVEKVQGATAASPLKTFKGPFDIITRIQQTDEESIFLWTLDNYEHIRELETTNSSLWHRSPPFYSSDHGYKFQLQISVVGEAMKVGGNLRVLMHLLRGEHDEGLPWPMRQELTIGISGLEDSFVKIEHEEEEPWTKPRGPLNPKLFYKEDFIELKELDKLEKVGIEIRFRNPSKNDYFNDNMNAMSYSVPMWQIVKGGIHCAETSAHSITIRNSSIVVDRPVGFLFKKRLTPQNNYFEIRILYVASGSVAIGLATPEHDGENQMPGWYESTIGYHGDDGNLYLESGRGEKFGEHCGISDIMGCGIIFPDNAYSIEHFLSTDDPKVRVFFTKNGKLVGKEVVAIDMDYPEDGLFPSIGIIEYGTEVEIYYPFRRNKKDFPMPESAS